ncbi:MAG: T9SS type A sorting domain-containing protein [Bacteroidia bacterium]
MKKAFLSLFFFFCVTNLPAQTWAPVGTKWTYSLSSQGGPLPPKSISCIGDTVIQSKICRIFNGNFFGSTMESYLYYENEKIFFYINPQEGFHLLYDFAAKAGDTLRIIPPQDFVSDTSIIIVDSIGTEMILGKTFNIQYVRNLTPYSDFWLFGGKIIKGIGNVNYFFPWPTSSMHIYYGPLRCYEDSMFKIKFSSFPCDTVFRSGFRPDNHVDIINIYPNPVISDVFIEFDFLSLFEFEIELFSDLGSKLIELKGANKMEVKIPMERFSKGIYVLKITTSTGQRIVRKIIKV